MHSDPSRVAPLRRGGTLAAVCVALVAASCGGSNPPSNAAAATTTAAAPATAPPTTTARTTTTVGAASLTPPPIRTTSPRKFEYEFGISLTDIRTKVELADPGSARFTATAAATFTARNLLTDRPAPIDLSDGAPTVQLLFEITPDLAARVIATRVFTPLVYDIGDRPFLAVGFSATGGLSETEAVREIPAGRTHTIRRQFTSGMGGSGGVAEDVAREVATLVTSPVRYAILRMDNRVLGGETCADEGGRLGQLVWVLDTSTVSWTSPEALGWKGHFDGIAARDWTACAPERWKP